MAVKTIKHQDFNWYYLTDFSNEELAFLKNNFKFHPLDLKDCAGEIQRTKIDIYKNYIFLVWQLPSLDKTANKVVINQVYFFISKKYVVTVNKDKIKSLNNLFYKILGNQKLRDEYFSKDSGYLAYLILDTILRVRWSIHSYLEQEIGKIEDNIDVGSRNLVFTIANLRRVLIQFKAIIDPQRLVTNTLSRMDNSFLDKETLVYFDDLDDFIEKTLFILESYRERILSLQQINESLISHRTNAVMKVLTVLSVALMPLTLLSGIYGMNIDLPYANHPFAIFGIFGILALIIIATLAFLKKKDWL